MTRTPSLTERKQAKYIFSAGSAVPKRVTDLDTQSVENWLVTAFQSQNIALTESTQISVVTQGAEWRITQGRHIYFIRNEEHSLNIYIRGVLVSYAREDEEWVKWFVRQLQAIGGFTVWWDRTSNFPGTDYRFQIREAIQDCDAFLFIATDTSISREEGGYWGELRDCYPRYREMRAGRKFIFVVNVDCKEPIPDEWIRPNESLKDLVATELSQQIRTPDKATLEKMNSQFQMLVKELAKVSPRHKQQSASDQTKRTTRNEVMHVKSKRGLLLAFRSMLLRTILAMILLTVFWLGVPTFAIVLASQYKTDFGVFPMLVAIPFGLASASVALINPKIIGRICYSL